MQGTSNDFNLWKKTTCYKLAEKAADVFVIWIKSLMQLNPCTQILQDT